MRRKVKIDASIVSADNKAVVQIKLITLGSAFAKLDPMYDVVMYTADKEPQNFTVFAEVIHMLLDDGAYHYAI